MVKKTLIYFAYIVVPVAILSLLVLLSYVIIGLANLVALLFPWHP